MVFWSDSEAATVRGWRLALWSCVRRGRARGLGLRHAGLLLGVLVGRRDSGTKAGVGTVLITTGPTDHGLDLSGAWIQAKSSRHWCNAEFHA
jgi:hypothetical protein